MCPLLTGTWTRKTFTRNTGTGYVGVKKRMSSAAGGRMINWDHMIELRPIELTALKELAAAGPRGRKSRAVRRDLARLIRAHYVTEQSASMDTVIYVITDLGRRALDELKGEVDPR